MSLFIASQILVGLAALFDIASFQFKNRTLLLSALSISALLIAAHFALLKEWTAVWYKQTNYKDSRPLPQRLSI